MIWDKDKRSDVYLLLNNQRYLIKYKQKFKQAFDRPKLSMSISSMRSHLLDSLENIDDDILIDLIDNAVEEAKIIQKRGEDLVRETIEETNAVQDKIKVSGMELAGYKLKGVKTGTEYFIQNDTLSVYRLNGGKWDKRCVVDDYRKERIYEDRLANRLINIYNEPQTIHTLFN